MNISILADLGLKEITMDSGTTLIHAGTLNRNVYVLVSGKIRLLTKGYVVSEVDNPGTIFGEVSALLNAETTADVVVAEKSTFYVIEEFLDFIYKHPNACVSVAQILACRLVNMNNHFVYIKDQLALVENNLKEYVPVFPEQSADLRKRRMKSRQSWMSSINVLTRQKPGPTHRLNPTVNRAAERLMTNGLLEFLRLSASVLFSR